MWDQIEKESQKLGFARLYALAPAVLAEWLQKAPEELRASLCWDMPAAYPQARCVLLLVYAYEPFAKDSLLPGYYFASNRCYFAAKEMIGFLQQSGHYAEEAKIPLRAFAQSAGIGTVGRNGLLRIPPFGSRIVLSAIATDACAPHKFPQSPTPPCPSGCTRCASACPTRAIGKAGLRLSRCMRDKMRTADHPDFVRERQSRFIGCEECMFACPFNHSDSIAAPDADATAAFDLARLIAGDTAAARALVGRNKSGNGKLTAEAIVFAARQGLYEADIRAAGETSEFPAVQNAATWALDRYFGTDAQAPQTKASTEEADPSANSAAPKPQAELDGFFPDQPQELGLCRAFEQGARERFANVAFKIQKSQIAFASPGVGGKMHSFAFVWLPVRSVKNRPEHYVILSFGLSRKLDSPRIAEVAEPHPNRWTHHMIVSSEAEMDAEFWTWMNEAVAFAAQKR